METGKRIAAVTGGTGGLGQVICRRLAGEGFSVVALHTAGNSRAQESSRSMWRASQAVPRRRRQSTNAMVRCLC
jgi:NAD(P)-dependent dehydrogenase (short-subunit alcohol dehydrogenase family)